MTEYQTAWFIYSGALIVFFTILAFWVINIQSIFWRSFLLAGLALFNSAFVVVGGFYSPLLAKVAVDIISGRVEETLSMLPYLCGLLGLCLLIAIVASRIAAKKAVKAT